MNRNLDKLISIGSPPIRSAPLDKRRLSAVRGKREHEELQPLLAKKNGFYAFEGALHVLSDLGDDNESGVLAWNQSALWRCEYQGMADNGVFFAEDAFGVQFALTGKNVSTFDPETGNFEEMASSLDEWAALVLADFGLWTGHEVAHDWQMRHGVIPRGSRLLPVTPFVLALPRQFSNRDIDAFSLATRARGRRGQSTNDLATHRGKREPRHARGPTAPTLYFRSSACAGGTRTRPSKGLRGGAGRARSVPRSGRVRALA